MTCRVILDLRDQRVVDRLVYSQQIVLFLQLHLQVINENKGKEEA